MTEFQPQLLHTPAYGDVDLTTCDTEPIHVPGAIQPHGVLLVLAGDLAEVVMVSANSDELLGVPHDEALGLPLAKLVGELASAAILARAEDGVPEEPLVLTLSELAGGRPGAWLADCAVDVRVHRSGDRWVVEIEPLGRNGPTALTYQSARGAMARLSRTESVAGLTGRLATEVRTLTGFDRVMVYRFDEDWNGEVVAEDRREDLNPFLGLHYPATDIPAQARRLYTVNWTRLIADIHYEPVPLHPVLDPETGQPLDLSHASLRSVSPIHVEYLSNMGVTASMSVSLVVDGKLWGLVACHHYSGPHRPSHDARSAAEFLGQVASQLVHDRVRSDVREAALRGQSTLGRLTARVSSSAGWPLDALMADPELLPLVDATGLAMCFDGEIMAIGDVPDDEALRRISGALTRTGQYATWSDRLSTLDPELAPVAHVAAGALRIGSAEDRWVVWLRPELEQVVDWGGDPTNKLLAATEGPEVRLSPRRSFEKWRQVVRGRSQPWEPWQVELVDALGKHVQGLLLLRSREQIAMAESVQRSVVLERAPGFAGVAIGARYLPASTYQLGGDWWDAFRLGDGRVAFVVGDVAGHGVAAASAMTQVRTALRAYLFEGHTPSSALDQLDRLMDGLLDQRVATAVIAVLDPVTARLEIASAGHPLPIVVDAAGAREVDVDSRPLLGIGAGTAHPFLLDLARGATLLLYTDGLVERRGIDMEERTERLRTTAEAAARETTDLEAFADHILVLTDGAEDDTTVLAIRLADD